MKLFFVVLLSAAAVMAAGGQAANPSARPARVAKLKKALNASTTVVDARRSCFESAQPVCSSVERITVAPVPPRFRSVFNFAAICSPSFHCGSDGGA